MSTPKGENNGLLSKVVRFVRTSTSNWSETDIADPARDSGYSKQMLKEMIERKRRNDFVRRREFDMLRKLRRNEVISSRDPLARPSFFQSSMPSRPDDRASTLKKIDEIEAQMSQQWWKTKGVEPTRTTGLDTGASFPLHAMELEVPTQPSPDLMPDLMPQRMPELVAVAAPPASVFAGMGGVPIDAAADSQGSLMASTSFSASKAQAVDVEMLAHDPELEEPAIRFANGDQAGAEVALLALLAPGSSRASHEETWLALFDLYRAAGQQARYDEQAMAYAGRFGRSAPQWRSLNGAPAGAAPARGPAATGNLLEVHWSCPPMLNVASVMALQATVARAAPPWRVNWASLVRIEPDAVVHLTLMLAQWATQPVQIRFAGTQALERVLIDTTPSGDRRVAAAWWRLRLEALRLMHRSDEFEVVALDYCVTYEVSPPSWERPRSQFSVMAADGGAIGDPVGQDAAPATVPGVSGFSPSYAAATTRAGASIMPAELAGTVLGDMSELLEQIDERLADAATMVISCARLARIDFEAAGTLLNWATARSAEGRVIHLTEVNRLVAEFFHVIGISTQARISLPRD